jgi:hypothetical protein
MKPAAFRHHAPKTTAVGATIASAIDDAVGIPGAVRELPVMPQRLKQLLAQK